MPSAKSLLTILPGPSVDGPATNSMSLEVRWILGAQAFNILAATFILFNLIYVKK